MSTPPTTGPSSTRATPTCSAIESWRCAAQAQVQALWERAGADREAQMDARRSAASLARVESAVQALLTRQERGHAPLISLPHAAIVHRNGWLRARLRREFESHELPVLGESDEGAAGLALVLVEQPRLLVLENRLPWIGASDFIKTVRRFAPETIIVVHGADLRETALLLATGADVVQARSTSPEELADRAQELISAAA